MTFTPKTPGPGAQVLTPSDPLVVGHTSQLTQQPPNPAGPLPPEATANGVFRGPPAFSAPTQPALGSSLPEVKLNFDLLPSKGLAYPPASVLKYRPYTFGELKRVNQSKLGPKDSIEFILSGVETGGMEKHQLTLSDTLYLGLLRKISSIGMTKVWVPYVCGFCLKPAKALIQSDKLEFRDLAVPALPVRVDFSFGERSFTPLTVAAWFHLLGLGKEEDEAHLMAAECHEGYAQNLPLFEQAIGDDAALLSEVDNLLDHGLKPATTTCSNPECTRRVLLELDCGQALLLPFREPGDSPRSRIHYGPQAAHPAPHA